MSLFPSAKNTGIIADIYFISIIKVSKTRSDPVLLKLWILVFNITF